MAYRENMPKRGTGNKVHHDIEEYHSTGLNGANDH